MVPDPGLAAERTALAWQRTALSVVAGAAILARLTLDRLGVLALLVPGLAACLGLWVFLESRWRFRRVERGGRAALSLAAGTVLLAITQAVAFARG